MSVNRATSTITTKSTTGYKIENIKWEIVTNKTTDNNVISFTKNILRPRRHFFI